MKDWTVYFINNALKRDGVWGIEAETEQAIIERFKAMHQPFCEIRLVREGNYKLDQIRAMFWAKQIRENKA